MLLIHKIISRYAVLVKSYKPLNVFIGKAKLAKKYQTGVEICEKYKTYKCNRYIIICAIQNSLMKCTSNK